MNRFESRFRVVPMTQTNDSPYGDMHGWMLMEDIRTGAQYLFNDNCIIHLSDKIIGYTCRKQRSISKSAGEEWGYYCDECATD